MLVRHRLTALVVGCGLVAALVGGCTSSGSSPSPSPSSSAAPTISPTTLADSIQAGLSKVHSAHVDADASALGARVSGDLSMANGNTRASDLHIRQGAAGDVEVITIGRTASYAKLPAGQNTSGKPWVKVTPKSSIPFVRTLSDTLHIVSAMSSIGDLVTAVRGASSVKQVGTSASTSTYDVVIVPSNVKGALGGLLHLTSDPQLPVRLVLDQQHRPLRADVTPTVAGVKVTFTVTVSDYNKRVHIEAPPASDVLP